MAVTEAQRKRRERGIFGLNGLRDGAEMKK